VAHLAARFLRIPYVAFAYGMEMTAGRFGSVKRAIWRRADRIVTISRFSARLLCEAGAPVDRVEILAPGLEEEWLDEPGDCAPLRRDLEIGDGPVLLTVARLDARERYKGHDRVLEALSTIRDRFPGIRYLVVGDGDDRSRLVEKARRLGVEDSVLFLGRIPDEALALHYRLADVFVMPGHEAVDSEGRKFEGFGIVFLEAAALGRPSIAGSSGGAPDAVVDGETGFVVDPHDPAEFEERLLSLLSDPSMARRMGRAGRRRVEREFLWSKLPVRERLSFTDPRTTS
jgi:phosphatidylinositol alpha-1,6-mannosyltransferase